MKPIVVAMPGNERLARELVARLDLDYRAVTAIAASPMVR